MSQYFEMGDKTLWNPSSGASRLFLRQVALFEHELELTSGIGPMEDDDCPIDPVAFELFVHALLIRHRRTSHAIVRALSEGFIATVLVLAGRAGTTVDWARVGAAPDDPPTDVQVSDPSGMSAPPESGAWESGLRVRARELSRFMPR